MSSIKKTFFTLLLIGGSHSLFAQYKSSPWEVGLHFGTLIYQGDLSKSFAGDYSSLHPAIGLYASRSIDPYFAIRGNFTYGKISEDEAKFTTPVWKQFRAFNFSTTIKELTASLVFSPFGDNNDRKISPYLFAGAGVAFVNVHRDWHRYDTSVYNTKSQVQQGLAIDTLHSPPRVIAILPVGAGLRYAIGSQWSLNAEATYRLTATDYLDGFKYAGNPTKRDGYYGFSLGVSYRFGGYKCPPAR